MLSIRQIHPVFVGEVSGLDLRKPLSAEEVAALEAGMDRYAVLVFHDQRLSDEEQMAFTLNFGVLEEARGGNITKPEERRLAVGDERRLESRQGRRAARSRFPPAAVQSGQHALALRQLVPGHPRQVLVALGAGRESEGRQHRVRRHAGGLRCPRRGNEGGHRGPGVRALAAVLPGVAGSRATTRTRSGRCSVPCVSGWFAPIR